MVKQHGEDEEDSTGRFSIESSVLIVHAHEAYDRLTIDFGTSTMQCYRYYYRSSIELTPIWILVRVLLTPRQGP